MLQRDAVKRQDVDLSLEEDRDQYREAPLEETRDPGNGLAGALPIGLRKDRAQRRRHHLLGGLRHRRERVAHEVDAAPLPGGAREHLGHRLLEPQVRVRGHQLDATQAAADRWRRKSSQNSRSSAGPTSVPSTSRSPVETPSHGLTSI